MIGTTFIILYFLNLNVKFFKNSSFCQRKKGWQLCCWSACVYQYEVFGRVSPGTFVSAALHFMSVVFEIFSILILTFCFSIVICLNSFYGKVDILHQWTVNHFHSLHF